VTILPTTKDVVFFNTDKADFVCLLGLSVFRDSAKSAKIAESGIFD